MAILAQALFAFQPPVTLPPSLGCVGLCCQLLAAFLRSPAAGESVVLLDDYVRDTTYCSCVQYPDAGLWGGHCLLRRLDGHEWITIRPMQENMYYM